MHAWGRCIYTHNVITFMSFPNCPTLLWKINYQKRLGIQWIHLNSWKTTILQCFIFPCLLCNTLCNYSTVVSPLYIQIISVIQTIAEMTDLSSLTCWVVDIFDDKHALWSFVHTMKRLSIAYFSYIFHDFSSRHYSDVCDVASQGKTLCCLMCI